MITHHRVERIRRFLGERMQAPCVIRVATGPLQNNVVLGIDHAKHPKLLFLHELPASMHASRQNRTQLDVRAITTLCLVNGTLLLKGPDFDIEVGPLFSLGRFTLHRHRNEPIVT